MVTRFAEACRGRRCTLNASAEVGVLSRCCCFLERWRRLQGRHWGCYYEAVEAMVLDRQSEEKTSLRLSRCGHGLWIGPRRRSTLGRKAWDHCRGMGRSRARGLGVCPVHQGQFGSCSSTVTALPSRVTPSRRRIHQMDDVHPVANSMKTPTELGIGWSRSLDSSFSSLPS